MKTHSICLRRVFAFDQHDTEEAAFGIEKFNEPVDTDMGCFDHD